MTGAPPPPPPPPGPASYGGQPGMRPPPPPPPGYAPSAPPNYPPSNQSGGTNGMAIASLVLGIISLPMCFLFVPALLAVIFGIIGLSQLKSRPGQGGRGQAIAGVILGGVSLAVVVLAIVLAGSTRWDIDGVVVLLL